MAEEEKVLKGYSISKSFPHFNLTHISPFQIPFLGRLLYQTLYFQISIRAAPYLALPFQTQCHVLTLK